MDVFKEGIHLTSLDNGVYFDFNNNGQLMHMAWTDPKYRNGFLALDRNHNGKIDGIQELFGALTQPQVKTTGRPNGWLALAIYDTPAYGGNGDGVIDAKDAIYSQLLLWIDENHDGISQPNELHHLADLGVTAIELKYDSNKPYTDQYGNRFQSESFVDIGPALSDKTLPDAQAWDVVLRAVGGSAGVSVFGKTSTAMSNILPSDQCYYQRGREHASAGATASRIMAAAHPGDPAATEGEGGWLKSGSLVSSPDESHNHG